MNSKISLKTFPDIAYHILHNRTLSAITFKMPQNMSLVWVKILCKMYYGYLAKLVQCDIDALVWSEASLMTPAG